MLEKRRLSNGFHDAGTVQMRSSGSFVQVVGLCIYSKKWIYRSTTCFIDRVVYVSGHLRSGDIFNAIDECQVA